MINKIGSALQLVGMGSLCVASFLLFGAVGLTIWGGLTLVAVGVLVEGGKV